MTDQPCFECGSTERIGTACKPCNPEITDPRFGMTHPHYIGREAVAKIIDPAAFMFSPGELDDKVYSASRAHAFDRADRILALIAVPMEAVAWRVRDKDAPRGWWLYGVHETETVAELKRQEHEVQALAVISTHGGGE